MTSKAFSKLFVFTIGLGLVLALGAILPGVIADGEHEDTMATSHVVPMRITALETGCPEGKSLCFDVSEIRVMVGDTVTITAVNPSGNSGEHDVTIDEFEVHIHLHDPGDEDSQSFVADQAGTYTFYCSVLGHRAAGMEGTLIVEAEADTPSGISTELVIVIGGVVAAIVVAAVVLVIWRRGKQ